jgi:hypothetical protein
MFCKPAALALPVFAWTAFLDRTCPIAEEAEYS